jgi:hypothetical protein
VPGHGAITDKNGVRELKRYLEYILVEARKRYDAGMSDEEAANDISMDSFQDWSDALTRIPEVPHGPSVLSSEIWQYPNLAARAPRSDRHTNAKFEEGRQKAGRSISAGREIWLRGHDLNLREARKRCRRAEVDWATSSL